MIKKIFNVKNPFWQSMNTIFDLFVLNILWLVCCLPVVTIGPATTAAYYALIQRVRGEDRIGIHKDFFYSFKENLKPGILLGLPLTALGAFLLIDIWLCRRAGTGIYTFFMVFFAIIFIFWAFTTLYAFPVLAKFERKTSQILIWAFTLSLKNLTMTLTMMFVIIAAIWLCHLIPGLIFIMFGIVAQFNASIFAVIFKPYLPKPFFMEEDDFMANTADETYASFYEGTYASLSDKNNVGYSDKSEASPADKTYSDFDEAAFYGEDPEEVARLLKEYETTQSHADF